MTKQQIAALNDFCEEFGYTRHEVLKALKENGTIERGAKLEDLARYVDGSSYDAMLSFLGDNL